MFTGLELITSRKHEKVLWWILLLKKQMKNRNCFDSSSSSVSSSCSSSFYYQSLWSANTPTQTKTYHVLAAADGHKETDSREMSDRQASRRPSYLCTPGGSRQRKHWCRTGRSGRDCWMCCSAAGELWCLLLTMWKKTLTFCQVLIKDSGPLKMHVRQTHVDVLHISWRC